MGIFKKHEHKDDDLVIESEFTPTDIVNIDPIDPKEYFSEDIGFHTGALKHNFTEIKNDSETLDIIKKKVVKNGNTESASGEEPDHIIKTDTDIKTDAHNADTDNAEALDNESLLERCKAYTVDENGKDCSKDEDSLYELMSVAEILKSDQLKSLDALSKKYDIIIEDETEIDNEPTADDNNNTEDKHNEPVKETDFAKTKTRAFVRLTEQNKPEDLSDDQKFEDFILQNNDTVIEDVSSNIPDISDIDNSQKMSIDIHDHSTDGATLKYIPVKDIDGVESRISISTTSQNINIGEKLNIDSHDKTGITYKSENDVEEIESLSVKKEINDTKDLSAEIKKVSIKKRSAFLSVIASAIISLVVTIVSATSFEGGALYSKGLIVFLTVAYALNCLANFRMYISIKDTFKKTVKTDLTTSILSVITLVMAVIMIIKPDKNFTGDAYLLIAMSSILLSVRCFASFFSVSTRLGDLKTISSKNGVYGVHFIDDQSIAYSIAKDSVEGDILIAAPHKTKFVNSFNRYTQNSSLLSGKFGIFQIVWLAITIMVGALSFAKYHSLAAVVYCVLCLVCILAFPAVYFINTLPCYSASKKLNKDGASIFGTVAAKQIDKANAILLSTQELFPSGTIVLKDMKILSDNNIDYTILRATSLTEALGSPLTPIFKKIAKTNSSYSVPDSDTVKYEDTLGISGWVENELLFVGNRALMETHGIEVPSIEVDKRILRNGCFPVYVATVQKACALLIVKYNPRLEIAKELRKLSGLGVTLLFINTDPNINVDMISDYFDIYDDSIKLVSNAGKFMYENTVISREPMPSPATFKRKNLAFVKIMNCASSINKSNNLFSILYIVISILLAVGFIYLKFAVDSSFFSTKLLFLTEMAATVVSLILYLFRKP